MNSRLVLFLMLLILSSSLPKYFWERKATVVWEYRESPDFFAVVYGDADRLPNGNTLITDGIHYDPDNARIVEVTKDGNIVWELITTPFNQMYRAERVTDIDMKNSDLYRLEGYTTPFEINVTVWDESKAYNGYTFFQAQGSIWGVNMTGHAIWQFPYGLMAEQKFFDDGRILLFGKDIRIIDLNGTVYFEMLNTTGHHDALIMPNGNLMYLAREPEECIRNGELITLTVDTIREITVPDGKVVWEWHASEFLSTDEFCEYCPEGDWLHSNSITYEEYGFWQEEGSVGSGKYVYLDVRNLNCILKIDYNTKKILWRLGEDGDFRLYEKDGTEVSKLFSHQHDPEILSNGNILLFDNGKHRDAKVGGYSRVIELELLDTSSSLLSKLINLIDR